ncbi:MAG: GIY-YIG nuclease family protein, partial [Mycoplasma sp.]
MSNLSNILKKIPELPGCYLWKNVNGEIIYVGKAKNLKKRTNQYFSRASNNRISKLVSEIFDIDYIVVNNENESLILENNLIKEYKPKYNVLLKEGTANYPYIILTKEKHPRLIYTRNHTKFKGKKYGPFANHLNGNAYEVFLLLQKLFPFRKCNKMPNVVCMYYHMKQCLGPCVNNLEQSTYEKLANDIDSIFNNKPNEIIDNFKRKEKEAANELNFELAKIYLDHINKLTNICNNQIAELNQ